MLTSESVFPLEKPRTIVWVVAVFLSLFHVGAIAALFMFNWRDIAVAAVLYWIAGSFGVCMGYHRLLTHRAFKAPKLVEYGLAACGALALEGGPVSWVATHRIHHQNSDQEGDPHTPRDGGWWAHMGWIIFGQAHHNDSRQLARFAPDLDRVAFYRWLNTYHWVPVAVVGIALLYLGGWSMVMWGVCFRTVLGLHATWLVNSATHMWGNRRFETRDDSKNNWWVALLTFGEGWHNNHHAHPTSARHGLAWYELDMTWLEIRLLEFVGLFKQVKVAKIAAPRPESEAA